MEAVNSISAIIGVIAMSPPIRVPYFMANGSSMVIYLAARICSAKNKASGKRQWKKERDGERGREKKLNYSLVFDNLYDNDFCWNKRHLKYQEFLFGIYLNVFPMFFRLHYLLHLWCVFVVCVCVCVCVCDTSTTEDVIGCLRILIWRRLTADLIYLLRSHENPGYNTSESLPHDINGTVIKNILFIYLFIYLFYFSRVALSVV